MPENPFDILEELMARTGFNEEEKEDYRYKMAEAIRATVLAYAGRTVAAHYTRLMKEDEEC